MVKFFDAWRFILDILVDILGKQRCRSSLYAAIFLHHLGMASQKIAKSNMAAQLQRTHGANVQMMRLQVRFVSVSERLPARNAQVSLVLIANCCEPLTNSIQRLV